MRMKNYKVLVYGRNFRIRWQEGRNANDNARWDFLRPGSSRHAIPQMLSCALWR